MRRGKIELKVFVPGSKSCFKKPQQIKRDKEMKRGKKKQTPKFCPLPSRSYQNSNPKPEKLLEAQGEVVEWHTSVAGLGGRKEPAASVCSKPFPLLGCGSRAEKSQSSSSSESLSPSGAAPSESQDCFPWEEGRESGRRQNKPQPKQGTKPK